MFALQYKRFQPSKSYFEAVVSFFVERDLPSSRPMRVIDLNSPFKRALMNKRAPVLPVGTELRPTPAPRCGEGASYISVL